MAHVKELTSLSPIGHLGEFRKNPLAFLEQQRDSGSDIVSYRFAHRKIYLLLRPELIQEVLVTKQHAFHKSKPFQEMRLVLGEGLLTSEDEFHMKQRRLMQPPFMKGYIKRYANDMVHIAQTYTASWQGREERLVSRDMMEVTLSIIAKTMFDMDIQEGHEKVGKHLDVLLEAVVKRIRSALKTPLHWKTPQNQEMTKAVDALNDVIYGIIEARRDAVEKDDLLGLLMRAQDEESGATMTNEQLRDEAMTIFLAGHETTANALSWCLYLLACHPEKAELVYQEVDRVLHGRKPSYMSMPELSYTQKVLLESMRLYPPAWLFGREAMEDVEIGDVRIKKGSTVMVSPYVMQRNEAYVPKAETFMPERFEDGKLIGVPEYVYFPFGGGPRVCIGNHFALLEMTLVLAVLMQQFRFELASEKPVEPDPLITLRPKDGLRLVVARR